MSGIAVFGGTFNPIHNGHVQMLCEVNKLSFIDKILVMPDNIPPHKQTDCLADNSHRLSMCKLATENISKAVVDDREIKRGGKSYTYYTVCDLKEDYPNDDIFLAIGGDMLMSLDSWFNADELFKLIKFIAFRRNGIDKSDFYEKVEALKKLGADIYVLDIDIVSVSSTEIREDIALGKNNNLVAESVYNYIIENKVYG